MFDKQLLECLPVGIFVCSHAFCKVYPFHKQIGRDVAFIWNKIADVNWTTVLNTTAITPSYGKVMHQCVKRRF